MAYARVAVAGQVHKVQTVDIVKVDSGRLARATRDLGELLALKKPVEQRRLAHVGAPGKRDLGPRGGRQLLGGAVGRLKLCAAEVDVVRGMLCHAGSSSVVSPS